MRQHTTLLMICLCCCASTAAVAATDGEKQKPKDLAGTYHCQGTNPNGSVYRGTVKIKRAGEAYKITWILSGQKHSGIGLYTSGVFSSTWTYNNDARQHGITSYKCLPNGQLQGKWISIRGGTVNKETLTPVGPNHRQIEGDSTKSVRHFK